MANENRKNARKRPYIVVLSVLASLVMAGTAYAAVNRALVAVGYVNVNGSVKLEIVNQSIQSPRPGETIGYAPGSTVTRDAINASLYFGLPGELRVIEFYLQNTGNFSTSVGSWDTSQLPDIATAGLEFQLPALQGKVLAPNEILGPYTIAIRWDPAYYNVQGGDRHFTLKLGYHL